MTKLFEKSRGDHYLDPELEDLRTVYEFAPETRALREAILAAIPRCDEIVHEGVRLWREKVHARLREQMRLQMHFKEETARVPVEVVDGVPRELFEILSDQKQSKIDFWLRMQRSNIENSAKTLSWLVQHENLVPDDCHPTPIRELQASRDWLQKVSGRLKESLDRIIQVLVNPDVLGTYWPRDQMITIHWLPIGLLAVEYDLNVQDIVPIVLFHEYVHAYHHLGFDSDGNQFSLNDFARSDTGFKEGIAQYYTFQLIQSYPQDVGSGVQHAWSLMQKHSSTTYKLREEWLGKTGNREEREKEILRMAVMKTRGSSSYEGITLEDFNHALQSARHEMFGSD